MNPGDLSELISNAVMAILGMLFLWWVYFALPKKVRDLKAHRQKLLLPEREIKSTGAASTAERQPE